MDIFAENSAWLLYFGLFIGPFIQEDTAVVTAASLSVSQSENWIGIFIAILAGLIASDSWKYWLGWAAKHHKWAKKFAQKDRVLKLKNTVLTHSIKTLFAVRFLPMARIPTYLAAGFFNVRYIVYIFSIMLSAIMFVSIIFTAFHLLGEILGEQIKTYMPIFALSLLIIVGGSIFMIQKFSKGKS